jgi:hypothetical protein
MIEQTYHIVLSTVVNELLRPLLAVLTPHVCLHVKARHFCAVNPRWKRQHRLTVQVA